MAYKLKDYTNASRYLILDGNLKIVGQLSIDGSIPLLSDSITHSIASEDTSSSWGESLTSDTSGSGAAETNSKHDPNAGSKTYTHEGTITVLEKSGTNYKLLDTKHIIAYYEKSLKRWYLLHISTVERTLLNASGHIYSRTLTLIDEALWRLHYSVPTAKTLNNCSLDRALTWCTQGMGGGWEVINNSKSSLRQTITFSGSDMGSATIQSLLQSYDVEMDCYALLNRTETKIVKKVIDVEDKVNDQRFLREAIVGSNVLSLTQTKIGNAITKLFVYSSASADNISTRNGTNLTNSNSDNSGGLTSIAGVNNGLPYLVDDSANRRYNPYYAEGDYLEGVIVSDSFVGQSLLSWGKKQLALLNHDRYAYTMTTTVDYNPPIGATIRAKDNSASPMIDITARIMGKTFSLTNPYGNTCTFGEFTTVKVVTPSWFNSLKGKLATAIDKAKNDPSSVVPVILAPDGTDFVNDTPKEYIMQAWEKSGNVNISSFVDPKGFVWKHINSSGLEDTTFNKRGFLQSISSSTLGTLRAYIDTDYITNAPEVNIDQSTASKLGYFLYRYKNTQHTAQYIVRLSTGQYLSSHNLGTGANQNDTAYVLWDSHFRQISSMIIQDGGHGSSFGVQMVGNMPYIWGVTKNFASEGARYRITKFPYVANATLSPNDSRLEIIGVFSKDEYIRVNYDSAHNYLGITRKNGDYEVYRAQDTSPWTGQPRYRINMYNYDFKKQQTFQSSNLKYPYVFWHSGDYDMMHDTRSIYCVNVVTGGQCFVNNYDIFNEVFGDDNTIYEPEALSTIDDNNLLISFNKHGGTTKGTYVYKLPLTFRTDVTEMSKGVIPE